MTESILSNFTTSELSPKLSNTVYLVIDNREERHKAIKNGDIDGNLAEEINKLRKNILTDEKFLELKQHFPDTEFTTLEAVYLTHNFPKIYRGFGEKHDWNNDFYVLIRLMCYFLKIPNTVSLSSFSIEKLYYPNFWDSFTEKISKRLPGKIKAVKSGAQMDVLFQTAQKQLLQAEILAFLKLLFYYWSGTELLLENDIVVVYPSIIVSKFIEKLKI